jgi:Outer membrane protein beta-barrel domain
MSFFGWLSHPRQAVLLAAAFLLVAGSAHAQVTSSNLSHDSSISSTESSSTDNLPPIESSSADAALPGNPGGHGAGGGGPYDNKPRAANYSRWTFVTGAGFNAPIGNDIPYITWGGNFTVGGGYRFSQRFSVLGEYQFIFDKLPGAFVAAGGGQNGNAHIQSITAAPVLDLFPNKLTSVYLVGGGGWYYKSTNFTVQVCCDFYGYPVNVTTNSFSSNQWGGSLGFGISHRLGGVYGDGTMKLFAEARYLFINTPPISEPNGLGTTGLIPVTLGVRF